MKRNTWMHLVLAAALVLVAGVALAESETVKVKVKKTSADHEVRVDVGGAAQVFTLADLADGEQREVPAGEHLLTVRREGDALHVAFDGEPIGTGGAGERQMLWITEGGEQHEISGSGRKVVIVKGDGASATALGEGIALFTSVGADDEEIVIELEDIRRRVEDGELGAGGEPRAFVFKHQRGATDPVVVDLAARKDMVTYRCDETGSRLTVRKEHAAQDSYTDPATGCVMARVETRRVKVVTVVEGGADPS